MSEVNKEVKVLSNEIRELISLKPGWVLRNGMSVFALLIILLLASTYFIRFPDSIQSKAIIYSVSSDGSNSGVSKTAYYANIYISKETLDKFKSGQHVSLRLPDYPYNEKGIIEGRLSFISKKINDSGYLGRVSLINGLRTNLQQEIPYKEGLLADAKIVTEELRLWDRILNQFKRFGKAP